MDGYVLLDKNAGTKEECAQKIRSAGKDKCGTMEYMCYAPNAGESSGCYCYPKLTSTFKAAAGHSIYKLSGVSKIQGYDEYANYCVKSDGSDTS